MSARAFGAQSFHAPRPEPLRSKSFHPCPALCPVHKVELLEGSCIPCDFGFPPAGAPHDPKTCFAGIDGTCTDAACVALGPVKKAD